MTKVAYARFDSAESVDVALHLTNSVMVDRALIVLPYPDGMCPLYPMFVNLQLLLIE